MGRKHHSKKHVTKKDTKKEIKELLNDTGIKNNDSDIKNYKDPDNLTEKIKQSKRHRKEKFIEESNSENDYDKCLKNDFPGDHYDRGKDNSSPEDHYDKPIGYDSSENHHNESVAYDSSKDLYGKFEEEKSPQDHYDKLIDYNSSEDNYDESVAYDSSKDLYGKFEEEKSPQDHYDKPIGYNSSEDNYNESVAYDSSKNLYGKFEEEKSLEDHYDKPISYGSSEDNFLEKLENNSIESYNYEHGKSDLDKDDRIKCSKASVTSKILSICPNTPQKPSTIDKPVVIKVPVVLSEAKVTISIISSIKLEYPALEVKRIKKNVYLTQCKLIPNSGNGDPNVGIIFISGFIIKNIEYVTKNCSNKNTFYGNIEHTAVKVPFDCTTRITFLTRPIFIDDGFQNEVELSENFIKTCDPCKENMFGRSTCEQNLKFTEVFNEEIFCKLVNAEIVECDTLENAVKIEGQTPINHMFSAITEKVVMNLTIKILQNQQIMID